MLRVSLQPLFGFIRVCTLFYDLQVEDHVTNIKFYDIDTIVYVLTYFFFSSLKGLSLSVAT